MDEAGIRFLIEIYKDSLVNSDEVQRTKKENEEPIESVKRYLDRLEQISKLARENSDAAYYALLEMYYDRYVIKESNIAIQDIPAGMTKESIIEEQKNKIREWVDYLTDPATSYPMWAKYWAFQGMLKMGVYNTTTGEYQKRTKSTVANFVDPNPALIANSISTVMGLLDGERVTPKTIKRLAKTQSFSKIYSAFEKQKTKEIIDSSSKEDGEWRIFHQGSEEEAKALNKSIAPYDTRWCTASVSTAIAQVCGPYEGAPNGGDFYVYYTKDENGKYAIPRIAIRCSDHSRIGEIRGVATDQNLEEGMELILEKKLKEMSFLREKDIEEALRKIEDLRELSRIGIKTENKIELSYDEVNSLYSKKYGFGWQQDPKVEKIIKKRNVAEDFKNISDIDVRRRLILNRTLPKGTIVEEDDLIDQLIVEGFTYVFEYASKRLTGNKDYALKVVKSNGDCLKFVTNGLNADEEVVSTAVKNSAEALQFASDELKKNPRIVDIALRLDSDVVDPSIVALEYVSPDTPNYKEKVLELIDGLERYEAYRVLKNAPTLQDDLDVVDRLVCLDRNVLQYASKRIQLIYAEKDWCYLWAISSDGGIADKDLLKAGLRQCVAALGTATKELRNDEEIILYAINYDGEAINYCSKEFINNHPNIVYKAVMKSPHAVLNLSKEFQDKYPNIVVSAISKDLRLINHFSEEFMIKNPGLVIRAIRKHAFRTSTIPISILNSNPDFALEVVENGYYSSDFKKIPDEYYLNNIDMTKKMIKCNPRIIPQIPEELIEQLTDTIEDALVEYRETAMILSDIPKRIIMERPSIIFSMLLKDPDSLEIVPHEFQEKYPEIIAYVVYKHPYILKTNMIYDRETVIKLLNKYENSFLSENHEPLLYYILPEKLQDIIGEKVEQKRQNVIKRRIVLKQFKERIVTNIADVLDFDGIKDLGKIDEKKIS